MPKTISKGDTGSSVVSMQSLLVEHGYDVSIDGIFGSATESQLKKFQAAEGLVADGICGEKTWLHLEDLADVIHLPIDWKCVADLLPQMAKQKYQLSKAQCPSNPPGVSLQRIGDETTNCVLFTSWIISKAFSGVRFVGDQWSQWMVSSSPPAVNPPTPGYGPRVCMQWSIATTAPGDGVWLVQYFTKTGGHSMLVVDYDQDTDKMLTLEANSSYGLDGVGWADIGNVRDVPNPGLDWPSKVDQTWSTRIDSKVAVHVARLEIDPASVRRWLMLA